MCPLFQSPGGICDLTQQIRSAGLKIGDFWSLLETLFFADIYAFSLDLGRPLRDSFRSFVSRRAFRASGSSRAPSRCLMLINTGCLYIYNINNVRPVVLLQLLVSCVHFSIILRPNVRPALLLLLLHINNSLINGGLRIYNRRKS